MTKKIEYRNVLGNEEFCIYVSEDCYDEVRRSKRDDQSNIPALASTVQKTKQWIGEIMVELECDNAQHAYHGMRAVLHTLRDRLTISEASDFAAQLPMLIRGMYYEGWQPERVPIKDRTKDRFLAHIRQAFPDDPNVDVEELTNAVLAVVNRHVSQGEMADIEACIPKSLRDLLAAKTANS
ncbi:MAG: DUF2267 domain-containing protein [Pirellula sp.]|jgi:uncharacterized protein (DUF2267 family)